MDRPDARFAARPRLGRRILVVALAVILGATVYGDNRGIGSRAIAAPASGAPTIREGLDRTVSGLTRVVRETATLGILYGTVLSSMEPGVRHSILAAVHEVREVCTVRPTEPPVIRCAAKNLRAKKPVRCTRA
jgi:hypothetical protein